MSSNEYIKTANLILGYLELRFINQHKDAELAKKERQLWATELQAKIESERITQANIVSACDLWADINGGKGFAPTVDQFINCLKKVSYTPAPALPINDGQIDYLVLWNQCDDKAKFRFFVDHPFNKVPPYIRLLFTVYNTEHRGWTRTESAMMVRFHGLPFQGAGRGAVNNHQREIIQYFINRKVAA